MPPPANVFCKPLPERTSSLLSSSVNSLAGSSVRNMSLYSTRMSRSNLTDMRREGHHRTGHQLTVSVFRHPDSIQEIAVYHRKSREDHLWRIHRNVPVQHAVGHIPGLLFQREGIQDFLAYTEYKAPVALTSPPFVGSTTGFPCCLTCS